MPKTASILNEVERRESFGRLLEFVAEQQNIAVRDIRQRLDRLAGSSGRNRAGDWSRYVRSGRMPTPPQLEMLAEVLRVPRPVLEVCAGYIDRVLVGAYAAAEMQPLELSTLPIDSRRAAFALLFSLFPSEEMHVGNRYSLLTFIRGGIVGLNLTRSKGFLTGDGWNAAWIYPKVFLPEHLVEHPVDPTVTYVSFGDDAPDPQPYFSIAAEIQVDIASAVAERILSLGYSPIPKSSIFCEAQRVLHSRVVPLWMRCDHAADVIHHWADDLDKETADEVREHVQPWNDRTLTGEAVSWIRGEREEPERVWL